jgi:hypothetical protein
LELSGQLSKGGGGAHMKPLRIGDGHLALSGFAIHG